MWVLHFFNVMLVLGAAALPSKRAALSLGFINGHHFSDRH
jgi:hypothetical protein